MRKALVIALLLVFIPGLLGGCSGGTNGEKEITVSAAASMKEVLGELKGLFEVSNPGIKVSFNFGGSGILQQQIEQGAPVDLFVSAGKKQMSALEKNGLVGEPSIIAGNKLVVVTPAGAGTKLTSLNDLTREKYAKIAIGNPDIVPAGKYAEEVFRKTGIMKQVKSRLVLAKDVRQVLTYVETGEADAGLVYMTDARISKKNDIINIIPDELHSPITYPAAVVNASPNQEEAEHFLNFLRSETAKPVFEKYGFTLP